MDKSKEFLEIMKKISQHVNNLIKYKNNLTLSSAKLVLEDILKEENAIMGDGDHIFTFPIEESNFMEIFSQYSDKPLSYYLYVHKDGVYQTNSGNLIQFSDSKEAYSPTE